jgi:ribosomal protein L11 methyltransferase
MSKPESDSATDRGASVRAFFPVPAAAAGRIADSLAETFDSLEVAIGSVVDGAGRWTITLDFRARPNATAVRALVALVAGSEAGNALAFEEIAAKDWVKASLDGLTPVAAGRFVVHGAHDRERIGRNAVGIEIEAALAFGTGHHGTTRGCLIALDRIARRTKIGARAARVLDVGTGSGVLAIAAARALRTRVLASDNDIRAVRAARANARLNRAGAVVEIVHFAGVAARRFRERGPFDLVLANILLGPLQQLAGPFRRLVRPGGYVVLSGLLPVHATAALAAYRGRGFVPEQRIVLDGWVTLVLRRRAYRAVAAADAGP